MTLGWAQGLLGSLPEAAIDVPFAFLAGGMVLNVPREELPEERESSFGAFALRPAPSAGLSGRAPPLRRPGGLREHRRGCAVDPGQGRQGPSSELP